MSPYLDMIDNLKCKVNPYTGQVKETKTKREPAEKKVVELTDKETELSKKLVAVEYWKQGFKKIRLFFVQRILLSLQIEVASAISALGLVGWKVFLSTEAETKSGAMKLGIQIKVREPNGVEADWECWSGGEAQRLRRAISFGLSNLIQRAAGVFFDWETFDEPTKGLSPEGVEDLLTALEYRSEERRVGKECRSRW